MKKKIILSVIALFLVSVFAIKLNADTLMQIDFKTPAVAPTTIPGDGEDVSATITETFDFSGVKFSNGSNEIAGISDLRKIIIGTRKASTTVSDVNATYSLSDLFESYFMAYCLDANKKYPGYGILSYSYYTDSAINGNLDNQIEAIVTVAIANNANYKKYVDKAVQKLGSNYYGDPVVSFSLPDGVTTDDLLANFEANQEITINVKSISFSTADGSKVVHFVINEDTKTAIGEPESSNVMYEWLTDNHDDENLPIKAKLDDLALQKYVAKDDSNISGYAHALWIVEHSYPTLSLEKTLTAAGTSLADLKTQVSSLPGNAGYTDDQKAEGYVYATIQYAIWHTTGFQVEGQDLTGYDTISNVPALKSLYEYLINASVDSHYLDSSTYSTSITVTKPEEGKELHEKKDDVYYYGPFSGTYNALVDGTDKMTVTINGTDVQGVTVVDESYNPITEVAKGQKFYIKVAGKAKIGSVSATLSIDGIETFKPASARGRVYYPYYTMGQNAMSGGKLSTTTITGNLDFPTNSKTGVQNVALLLMVTLVAFTLGYLVLSYKTKPVSLN